MFCRDGLPSKLLEGRGQGIDVGMLPKEIGPRHPGGNSACPCRVPNFGWHAQKSAVTSRRPARPTSPRQSVATLLRSANSLPNLVSSKSKWPWIWYRVCFRAVILFFCPSETSASVFQEEWRAMAQVICEVSSGLRESERMAAVTDIFNRRHHLRVLDRGGISRFPDRV